MDTELVAAKEGQLSFHAGMSLGQLAKTIAGSGCFGHAVNPYVAAVKILAGQEIGIGPVESMRGLHVFDGKIELGAAVMSSKIKGSGFFDYEVVQCDDDGTVLECFEKSQRTNEWRQLPNITFTREEAQRAGLLNKKGPWQNYFSDMCFARALSRFFRRYCPHLAGGAVYAEGEASTDLRPDPEPPRGPGGAQKPAPAPTEDAAGEAAIDKAREVAESNVTPTRPAQATTSPGSATGSTSTQPTPGICEECGCGSAMHLSTCSKKAGATPAPVDPDEQGDPREHPYARFIEQSGELKAGILTADLGVDDRYRNVFKARGLENRAGVGKGDTKVQREILLELHDALREAVGEKAEREALADNEVAAVEVEAGMNEAVEANPENASMDPDIQPGPAAQHPAGLELPFT